MRFLLRNANGDENCFLMLNVVYHFFFVYCSVAVITQGLLKVLRTPHCIFFNFIQDFFDKRAQSFMEFVSYAAECLHHNTSIRFHSFLNGVVIMVLESWVKVVRRFQKIHFSMWIWSLQYGSADDADSTGWLGEDVLSASATHWGQPNAGDGREGVEMAHDGSHPKGECFNAQRSVLFFVNNNTPLIIHLLLTYSPNNSPPLGGLCLLNFRSGSKAGMLVTVSVAVLG